MAISALSALELAILAMDSYNRGYGRGLGLPVDGTKIGNATVLYDSETAISTKYTAQAAGFYAIAYEINGEIVISYRGTEEYSDLWDFFDVTPLGELVLTDIPIAGQDDFDEPSIHLAMQFYNEIKVANSGKIITTTGHSLGGALAGFIGAMYGDAIPLTNGFHA